MKSTGSRILVLAAMFSFLSPLGQAEQPQKSQRVTAEDRIKKLEERADAAEKAAAAAALEKDYILRTQKLYESYYQRTLTTQLWALGMVALLLTAVFSLVARFSLNLFEQRTKLATADATAQLRNEYSRILGKEVQKLWDSNAADNRKLKEALTSQTTELLQSLKDRSDFQIHFVKGLGAIAEDRHDESVTAFRLALASYKSCKPRNLIDTQAGATAARYVFESLGKKHGDNCAEHARQELSDPLYNGLEEELALAALQTPWLTPLISERKPAPAEPPPSPEPALETRPTATGPAPVALPSQPDSTLYEESDSCRLLPS